MNAAERLLVAALGEVLGELDWELLGRASCDGDGTPFFDAALRGRVLDTGLVLAGDLFEALGDTQHASLYLGAEVAELPPMLAESLVLGRRVEWLNLDGPIPRELARALAAVQSRLGIELPTPKFCDLADVAPRSCDHLWIVSVLTDPDHFPALHDELYGRSGGRLATGRGDLGDDRARAGRLVDALLDRATPTSVLTTTDEERTILEPLVARRGGSLEFAPGGRVSAVVGDLIRIGTLRLGR